MAYKDCALTHTHTHTSLSNTSITGCNKRSILRGTAGCDTMAKEPSLPNYFLITRNKTDGFIPFPEHQHKIKQGFELGWLSVFITQTVLHNCSLVPDYVKCHCHGCYSHNSAVILSVIINSLVQDFNSNCP